VHRTTSRRQVRPKCVIYRCLRTVILAERRTAFAKEGRDQSLWCGSVVHRYDRLLRPLPGIRLPRPLHAWSGPISPSPDTELQPGIARYISRKKFSRRAGSPRLRRIGRMVFAIGSTFSFSQAQRDKTVSGIAIPPRFRSIFAAALTIPPLLRRSTAPNSSAACPTLACAGTALNVNRLTLGRKKIWNGRVAPSAHDYADAAGVRVWKPARHRNSVFFPAPAPRTRKETPFDNRCSTT
jgi:hypothetical protein